MNGSQVYYSCREIDAQVDELVKTLTVRRELRPQLEGALHEWLDEMNKDGEDSELSRARQRLTSLVTKRKNINRMAAEELIGWGEFRELRDEVESEEAELQQRIDFITRHKALLSADFELALDIACNLGWLYDNGSFEEKRLLAETMFKVLRLREGKIADYELNPPFAAFCYFGKDNSKMVRYESLVAGEEGFEPSLADPESAVLPLDDSPVRQNYICWIW